MSSLRTCLPFALLLAVSSPFLQAQRRNYHVQQPKTQAFSAGVYALGGLSRGSQPRTGTMGLQGEVGAFAEYARHRLRPGLDARLAGEVYSFPGLWDGGSTPGGTATQKVIGPRLAYAFGDIHPYVEALFGAGQQNDTPQRNYYSAYAGPTTLDSHGRATVGVFGCDFDADTHVNLRAEYSIGSISDHGYPIQNFSGGIVFRFP